jgi:uncharacterized membrane protein YdjX (TVP38/TMEM64 family)
LGGLIFAPLTVLIAATAAAFGPVNGFYMALAGSLASAYVTFLIGYFSGKNLFQNWTNTAFNKITSRVQDAGVLGIATLRMIPLAPYTLVNMILGVTKVKALSFMLGTLLGLLPGIVAMVVLGDAIAGFWREPDIESLGYAALGIAIWFIAVLLIHTVVGRVHAQQRKIHV